MMHAAVDAHNLATDWRGIGRYVRALLARFVTRDDLRLTLMVHEWWPARTHATLAALVGSDNFLVARRVPRECDVVWHPWNGTFFQTSRPAVVTFHDAVPFRWPNPDPRIRENEQKPFVRSAQTARRFLANSNFTAHEITAVLGVDAHRITTALLGIEPVFFDDTQAREMRAKPYLLYVGATEPRKNVNVLIEAWMRAFPDRDIDLLMAGSPPPDARGAIYLGALERDAIIRLYRGARGVAVPSLYEGFGFPLAEAMACGTPVAYAAGSSLDEVAGACGIRVTEPQSIDAWVDALRMLAGEAARDESVIARARAQAATFTWERCAQQTFETLHAAAFER